MIPILPDQVLKSRESDSALRRAYRLVRKLPLPGARAWLSLHGDAQPDFLVIDGHDRAFLLTAIGLRPAEAEEVLQPGLFEIAERTRDVLGRLAAAEVVLGGRFPGDPLRVLLFPGLAAGPVGRLKQKLGRNDSLVHWLGDPVARGPERFVEFLESAGSEPLSPWAAADLRALFSPETQVPAVFVPKISAAQHLQANRGAQFSGDLLDFDQETWVKADLVLDDASARAAEGQARLITGAAGSGKSLALLYRARLLAALGQHRRILFTTHNKPLIADLEWRFEHLASLFPASPDVRIDFLHFFRWLGQLDPRSADDGLELVYDLERISLIRELAAEAFPDSPWPLSFLVEEIAMIADQVDDSESAYLRLARSGRGVPLAAAQRRRVHKLYRRYRTVLAGERKKDWYTLVRIVWERIAAKQLALPRYDLIFVDEGQFFAPLWFAILKRCLAPGGEMIVAADPTQGFLKRHQSWRSVGLDVRGRATRLTRAYRNTPVLQAFARRFYQSRCSDEDGEEITLPDGVGDGGSAPGLVRHRSPQDALAWAAAEVAAGIRGGLPPGAFLIIHADSRLGISLQALVPDSVVLDHSEAARERVAITGLNAATGIERPIVILLGLDDLFEKEGDPRLLPVERKELVRDHTRKVYMAITRAGERLLISYADEDVRRILCGESQLG